MSDEVKDEFDSAWDEDENGGKQAAPDTDANAEGSQDSGDDANNDLDTVNTSASNDEANNLNDDSSNESNEGEPDYKELYEKERQARKSFEGRHNKEKTEMTERLNTLEQKILSGVSDEGDSSDTAGDEHDDGDPNDAVESFKNDYPEVADGIQAVVDNAFNKIKSENIDPLTEEAQKMAMTNHFTEIENAHSDWQDVVSSDEFDGFIESQPSYIADAMRDIKERGNAGDVISLISQFKDHAGTDANADTQKLQNQKEQQRRNKQEEIDALAGVKGSSGGAPGQKAGKNDFDGGWDEAEALDR